MKSVLSQWLNHSEGQAFPLPPGTPPDDPQSQTPVLSQLSDESEIGPNGEWVPGSDWGQARELPDASDDLPKSLDDTVQGQVVKGRTHNNSGPSDVYEGTLTDAETGTTRAVALKVLRRSTDLVEEVGVRKLLQRFHRERSIWEKLNHPNVIPLLGTWTDPTQQDYDFGTIPYFISPWYANGDMISYIERTNPDEAVRYKLLKDTAAGLRYLHSLNLVHGDLWPRNILIDDDGNALILDFGFSKFIDQRGHTSDSSPGSSRYSPPEQGQPEERVQAALEGISRAKGTKAGDVWSFAMIVLRVLGGFEPYRGYPGTRFYIPRAEGRPIRRSKYPGLDKPEWDTLWETVLQKCWRMNLGERPSITTVEQSLREIRPELI